MIQILESFVMFHNQSPVRNLINYWYGILNLIIILVLRELPRSLIKISQSIPETITPDGHIVFTISISHA